MTRSSLAFLFSVLLTCVATGRPAVAQEQHPAEAAIAKEATKLLMRFASFARGKKDGPMEKQAYDLIITEYDPDHSRARKALDYKKGKDGWELAPPSKRKRWRDESDREARFKVQEEWREVSQKLAAEHRELGLAMRESDGAITDFGKSHLARAILYDPLDPVSHEALGHVGWESNGLTYYGTEADVAFMKRMKEIETFALMLAKKEYEVEPVDDIPEELNALGLEIYGARTKNFTVFTRGTQENAIDVVQWGERGLDFLEYCAGKYGKRVRQVAQANLARRAFVCYLWTKPEMDLFKEANAEKLSPRADLFANLTYDVGGGKYGEVQPRNMPSSMHDDMIADAWHRGLAGVNGAMLEGLHHAATWFLKSTCITKYGDVPSGTVTEFSLVLPDGANWWLREMRNQAIARTDVPLNVVPRTQLSNFPPEVRLKSWSFATWMLARYPEKWFQLLLDVPADKIPFPEEIDKIMEKHFGASTASVESDWRDWASGRGVAAAATGYGPPLLPEFPNDDELDALGRLDEVRAAASFVSVFDSGSEAEKTSTKNRSRSGWEFGLPNCELDSEATAACSDHAKFLTLHKDHWKWPEAHEEDPAKEGFTPKGMRAGLRSVIVMSEGQLDSKDSVDQWIGTVYHRFPLLEYNIKRFGVAHESGPEGEVVVLDMGSLQEPPNTAMEQGFGFVAWPPDGLKDVPRQFAYTEHPNPIEDVGLDFDAQKNTGYPVSLQFTDYVMRNSTDATMKLYEAKKRGAKFENGDEIPCWLHTPDEPLYKRMVMRDVVFVIPKEVLAANETYKAVVDITFRGVPRKIEWTFTTGTQMQGLGRLK